MSPVFAPRRPSGIGAALSLALVLGFTTACHHGAARVAPPEVPNAPVGYGEQSIAQSGGSSSEVETAGRQRAPSVARAEELLEGRFAGVNVRRTASGGFHVEIRGVNSFYARTSPLYVIDGTPVEVSPSQGLSFVSPSDIARIVVLKDPAETAIYGVRGANGVVLITTKRAR